MREPQENSPILDQFKVLYKDNAPLLISLATRYVDRTTAEDLVQDIFLKIWQKREFIFLKEGIKTYLYRSVQHACLDYLKHQDVKGNYTNYIEIQLKIEELNYNDEFSSILFEDERMRLIYKEINHLPEKCKEVFTMAYLEEKKTNEIADILNISKRTVESQLYKALKIIRNALLFLILFI